MAFAAAALACSLVNSICLCKISSALSIISYSSSFSSTSVIFSGFCSFSILPAGNLESRMVVLLDNVWIYSLRSDLALLRVAFAGSCGSSVGAGAVMVF